MCTKNSQELEGQEIGCISKETFDWLMESWDKIKAEEQEIWERMVKANGEAE